MRAIACDLLGEKPALELTDYHYISVSGQGFELHLEVRDGCLVIRKVCDGPSEPLLLRPSVANQIEILLTRTTR